MTVNYDRYQPPLPFEEPSGEGVCDSCGHCEVEFFRMGREVLEVGFCLQLREFFTDEALHERHDCGQWEPS